MKTIVLVTGGFDPLHSGHIAYFTSARELGDELWVGINSDEWLTNKKGRAFMPINERLEIIKNLSMVSETIEFNDADGTANDAIRKLIEMEPNAHYIFANGGDRKEANVPEMERFHPRLDFVYGVGGENKKNSSSWILNDWKSPRTERQWGYYRVLDEHGSHTKLKELVVKPGKKLSMQRHRKRAEHWFVAEGTAKLYGWDDAVGTYEEGEYSAHEHIHIDLKQWHQLANETDADLKIIEIQYGTDCVEEDIERK